MHSLVQPGSGPFRPRYAAMSEPELLAFARSYDTLTEAAQSALRAEFAARNLLPPLLDEADPHQSSTLVTVARYRDLSEAIVARSMLESAGISVFLQDENLVRLDWQVSNFIGGIRLQVPARDSANALELLTQPTSGPIAFAGETGQPDFVQPRCPHCGSAEIAFEGASRAASLTGLYLLGVPLPAGRETWLCRLCGTRWEDEP